MCNMSLLCWKALVVFCSPLLALALELIPSWIISDSNPCPSVCLSVYLSFYPGLQAKKAKHLKTFTVVPVKGPHGGSSALSSHGSHDSQVSNPLQLPDAEQVLNIEGLR